MRSRRGFTFPELLTVVALSALVVVALQQALVGQLRFHETQRSAAGRNESVRFALSVLGTTLRETSVSGGDVEILAPNRVRVRVFMGSGLVCGSDNNGSRVGIVDPKGRWVVGDSAVVPRASGRFPDLINATDIADVRVRCTLLEAGFILRMDQRVPDVTVGSAVRTFRSQILESVVQGNAQYLYRVDGAQRDLLAGPLDLTAGFTVWYEDAAGAPVPDLASAERLAVQIVARGPDIRGAPPLVRDTLFLRFGGRN